MADPERTQLTLAEERTHAAWIRTCLTFLVSAVAIQHYHKYVDAPLAVLTVLCAGGLISAVQAQILATKWSTRILCMGLMYISWHIFFSNL
jgi:uncharacterized membrane protein YidH (DUF202 family)